MKLSISRYDPERDKAPHLQDYDIELIATDHMLLDVLLRLKAQTALSRFASRAAKACAVPTR
jgi:succinate dehydrogenase/fumarate reductase-like Fe-S protein